MKRKLSHCAALVFAAGSLPLAGWSQPAAEEARHWLERMIQATQTLNYEGTFIYVQGPHVEAMRVIHGGGPKGERQRLFSLNGPLREILVTDNSVTCLLPKQHATFGGDGYGGSRFPLSVPRELGRLEGHYEFETLGKDRIAGLETQVIAIKPRDAWRFGYRLWLDRHNGMLLRSILLDGQGFPVEQIMFTDFQIKPRIDDEAFKSPSLSSEDASPPEADRNSSDGQPPSTVEPVTRSAWRVSQLPDGFVKVLHNRFIKDPSRHVTEHMVFADGLATISVFLERLDGAPALLQGGSQLGSMNAFGKLLDGHQILVVGEVPAETVQRIAAAIQYIPEAVKP
ncbi:MAG: MucB/RseB C-terminal domain-containing protein [Candidatus Competibacter sp.]|nr:MucB/RseB C-terminal domain-containing protein [Candidatus Competibacter sp.]MDG4582473.1 MucB/RseB C-terminal domain-containing protein [Candidatus Competibacter sp.]